MNENLSIDEIIRQAEEIRKKTVEKAQSAIEEIIENAGKDIPKQIETQPDCKTDKTEKTAVVDSQAVKAAAENGKTKIADQKTKAVQISEKTNVIPNVNGAKKSFFKNTPSEPLYSKTPPEIMERPATIKSKSRFDKTSDLQEIPTIVAVDELEHTKISFGNSQSPRAEEDYNSDESDQIVLEGFEDSTDKIAKIDEEIAEKQLKQRRQEKVNKFRLFSPENISGDKHSAVKNEYRRDDDKTAFMEKLFASKSSFTLKGSITAVIAIPLLLLAIFKDSAYMPSFLLDLSLIHI